MALTCNGFILEGMGEQAIIVVQADFKVSTCCAENHIIQSLD
jgi:hypothetical protein